MSKIDSYDSAYAHYLEHYDTSNPRPLKPSMAAFWRDWFVRFMLVVAVAAFMLSALRTGPVFHDIASQTVSSFIAWFEGVLAIIVIEAGSGVISFYMVIERYKNGHKTKSLSGWLVMTLIMMVVLGIATNTYATIGIDLALRGVNVSIAVLAGVIATVVLWLTGHILGVKYTRTLDDNAADIARYDADLKAWLEEREARWRKASVQRKWLSLVAEPEIEPDRTTTPRKRKQPQQTTVFGSSVPITYSRTVAERARQVLELHPDILELENQHDVISKACGVAKGYSTTQVINYLQDNLDRS